MLFEHRSPRDLKPNPWNTNHLSPEAEIKLETSLARYDGLFKPILIRTLPDGTFQILGGEHRNAAAERLGYQEVPVINLGMIDDQKAKEISLLDNGRYGHDDAAQLSRLLAELGQPQDIASFMPFDMAELETISAASAIDLDALDLAPEDAPEISTEKPPRALKTHATMRFRVPVEDQPTVEATIKQVISDQALDDSDSLVNAGDALMWIVRRWMQLEEANAAEV